MHQLNAEEAAAFQAATSYAEAARVAIAHAKRRYTPEKPLIQVCGPISTGGLGDRTRNLIRLADMMDLVTELGHPVFNQLQFEGMVERFSPTHSAANYDDRILYEFYHPLLNQQYIRTLVFIEGWETSTGARWERALGESFKLEILELEELLRRHGG